MTADEQVSRLKIWAVIPVKPFNLAKTRLANTLPPHEREQLAEELFRHTLQTVMAVTELSGVLVVSRDTHVLALARSYKAHTVAEDKSVTPDLNVALTRGSHAAVLQGASAILVLPADLPLIAEEDIRAIIDLARYDGMMVIAPDRRDQGTNALLVTPPHIIPYQFGDDSYVKHCDAARSAGATVKTYRSERVQLDIDTPDDLHFYQQHLTAKPEPS